MTPGAQEYTTAGSYTFNVPAGVNWVWASGIGAGAGGGSGNVGDLHAGGAGGSGESCDSVQLFVTPGGTLAITVGLGGHAGQIGVATTNTHAGPEGNTAAGNSGQGGGDTLIGPLTLKGGFAGLSTSGHGGMGGGVGAGPLSGSGGGSGSNCGDQIGGTGSAGHPSSAKDCGLFWAGSGGGAGSFTTLSPFIAGGAGGDWAPWSGGVGGTTGGSVANGGGGGAASIFGPGAPGGNGNASAGAVPAGSYGAGGGGAGGTTGARQVGSAGADGYVLLTWVTA